MLGVTWPQTSVMLPRLRIPALLSSFPVIFSSGKKENCDAHSLKQCFPSSDSSSVQLLSCVRLFTTLWTAARQASLSITNSWSILKLTSIALVLPSNHLILCHRLLLPPSIFRSIRVFSSKSVLHIKWPKYWSLTFSISPSKLQD